MADMILGLYCCFRALKFQSQNQSHTWR